MKTFLTIILSLLCLTVRAGIPYVLQPTNAPVDLNIIQRTGDQNKWVPLSGGGSGITNVNLIAGTNVFIATNTPTTWTINQGVQYWNTNANSYGVLDGGISNAFAIPTLILDPDGGGISYQAAGSILANPFLLGTGNIITNTQFGFGFLRGSTIGGGNGNVITARGNGPGTYDFIGSGNGNIITGAQYAVIMGGIGNTNYWAGGTIGGGEFNSAGKPGTLNNGNPFWPTVGGGSGNVSAGDASTIAGGENNTAMGPASVIAGGGSNFATNYAATVAGGFGNSNNGNYSSIGGGYFNYSDAGQYNSIAGGWTNFAYGSFNAIGGGSHNTVSNSSTIPGGISNSAIGQISFAAGGFANANNDYSFVWSDGTAFASPTNNSFSARAANGFNFIGAPATFGNTVNNTLIIQSNANLYWGNNATVGFIPAATNATVGQVLASAGGNPQQLYWVDAVTPANNFYVTNLFATNITVQNVFNGRTVITTNLYATNIFVQNIYPTNVNDTPFTNLIQTIAETITNGLAGSGAINGRSNYLAFFNPNTNTVSASIMFQTNGTQSIGIRNGDTPDGSLSADLRIYGHYASDAAQEALVMGWNANGDYRMFTHKGASGSARQLEFGTGDTMYWVIDTSGNLLPVANVVNNIGAGSDGVHLIWAQTLVNQSNGDSTHPILESGGSLGNTMYIGTGETGFGFMDGSSGVEFIRFALNPATSPRALDVGAIALAGGASVGARDTFLLRTATGTWQVGTNRTATSNTNTIQAASGTGSDVPGGDLALSGGRGTGAGAAGTLYLQTAGAAGSSSTLQTATNRVAILDGAAGGIVVVSNNVAYSTNSITSTLAPDFYLGSMDIVTNAAFTVLAPVHVNPKLWETCVVAVTNSTAAAVAITLAGNLHIQGTLFVTNLTILTYVHDGNKWTNVVAYAAY